MSPHLELPSFLSLQQALLTLKSQVSVTKKGAFCMPGHIWKSSSFWEGEGMGGSRALELPPEDVVCYWPEGSDWTW